MLCRYGGLGEKMGLIYLWNETEGREEKAQPSVAVHGCFEDRERELMKVVLSWLNVVISPQ